MGLNAESQYAVVGADEQSLTGFKQFRKMNEKFVKILYGVLCKPGGGGAGVKVSADAEENLKAMVFFIKHYEGVSRTIRCDVVIIVKIDKLTR